MPCGAPWRQRPALASRYTSTPVELPSRTRPVRELKGFVRVALRPGERREVKFSLRRDQLMFVGEGDRWTVEPGRFDLWVANSAADGLAGGFELLAAV